MQHLTYFFKLNQSLMYFYSLVNTVKEKGGKADRKSHPLPYGLRNPYRNLKSKNFQDYAQKPQQNCTSMNLALGCLSSISTECIQCWSSCRGLIVLGLRQGDIVGLIGCHLAHLLSFRSDVYTYYLRLWKRSHY